MSRYFVKKFHHFGKTIVVCRGVTRLDGAWGKKQVWRPHVRTWGLFGNKCTVLKQVLMTWLWLFRPPQWFGARGIALPCSSRYVSGVIQQKSANFSKINKFSSPNVMNFYSVNICNFRIQSPTAWILRRLSTKVTGGISSFFV